MLLIRDCPRSLAAQGAGDADQVAFRVLETTPLASIRGPSNRSLSATLSFRVSAVSNSGTATPHLLAGSVHVGHLNSGVRELRRRLVLKQWRRWLITCTIAIHDLPECA
jgi:hypothetical protein